MKPCTFCRRRAVKETESGALCAACLSDAQQEGLEAFGEDPASEIVHDQCVADKGDGCACTECRLIEDFLAGRM